MILYKNFGISLLVGAPSDSSKGELDLVFYNIIFLYKFSSQNTFAQKGGVPIGQKFYFAIISQIKLLICVGFSTGNPSINLACAYKTCVYFFSASLSFSYKSFIF